MRNEDTVNSNFGLLPEEGGRWGSFGTSFIINGSIAALLLIFVTAKVHEKHLKDVTMLVVPVDTPKPKPVPPPPPAIKIEPPPVKLKIDTPKIEPPKIEPPPVVKLDEVKPPPILPPAPAKVVAPPPAPKLGMFDTPKAAAANQPKMQVQTTGFTTQMANANTMKQQVQSAGFENKIATSSMPKGQIAGVGFGAGVASSTGPKGKVSTAGFSNGVVGGTGTGPKGTIGSADFGAKKAEATIAVAKTDDFSPPVVLSEPHAEYTADAQAARIQGEVTLRVNFLASGQVQVLGVVTGLGHGLDESAKRVAENIRFKPAMKNGQPVDHVTLIHITFQLA